LLSIRIIKAGDCSNLAGSLTRLLNLNELKLGVSGCAFFQKLEAQFHSLVCLNISGSNKTYIKMVKGHPIPSPGGRSRIGYFTTFALGFVTCFLLFGQNNMYLYLKPSDTGGQKNVPTLTTGGHSYAASTTGAPPGKELPSLEKLMYKYGSDKSKDDHGYTNLYQILFDPIRDGVRNMTEIGISAGQSLQAWYDYFPNAEIHGYDLYIIPVVRKNLEPTKSRVHIHIQNVLEESLAHQGLVEESMDIVIEDASHAIEQQEALLQKMFPLVKPGGYYIIEDIGFNQGGLHHQGGLQKFHEAPEKLQPATQAILNSHDCVFVDTSPGHRAWDTWVAKSGMLWVKDHVNHNSYLFVIHKRVAPLQPVKMNAGRVAMQPGALVPMGEESAP
jgi:hypothetical protein